jgi:hypothetical protein
VLCRPNVGLASRKTIAFRNHRLWFGGWQFMRGENSAAQRSEGAAESVVNLRHDHAPLCPLRGQTESQRNPSTGARVCDPQQRPICRRLRFFRLRSGWPNCCGSQEPVGLRKIISLKAFIFNN